jgi:hypothetical protein
MNPVRTRSMTPGTVISLIALFFAFGGSALAVGERMQSATAAQQRCANGAVRGVAVVTGNPAQGIANIPGNFTSANALFGRKFNCTGRAIQVRRTELGVYEVRFVANSAPSALAGGVGGFTATTETISPGTFRVRVQDVGRASSIDGPFMVVAV